MLSTIPDIIAISLDYPSIKILFAQQWLTIVYLPKSDLQFCTNSFKYRSVTSPNFWFCILELS